MEEYQKHQLQHKNLPSDIEFYDEHGSPVTYRIQHDDNPNDTCNYFYPIHCQQGADNKVLRMHIDGANFTLNRLIDEFPTITNNLQPIVSDWAEQSINSNVYAYPQRNP